MNSRNILLHIAYSEKTKCSISNNLLRITKILNLSMVFSVLLDSPCDSFLYWVVLSIRTLLGLSQIFTFQKPSTMRQDHTENCPRLSCFLCFYFSVVNFIVNIMYIYLIFIYSFTFIFSFIYLIIYLFFSP